MNEFIVDDDHWGGLQMSTSPDQMDGLHNALDEVLDRYRTMGGRIIDFRKRFVDAVENATHDDDLDFVLAGLEF